MGARRECIVIRQSHSLPVFALILQKEGKELTKEEKQRLRKEKKQQKKGKDKKEEKAQDGPKDKNGGGSAASTPSPSAQPAAQKGDTHRWLLNA